MPDVRSFRSALAFALVLAGCATAGPGSGEEGGKQGIDLEALVKRELPAALPKSKVSLFKGLMTGEIEAAGAIKTEDGKLGEDGEAAEVKVPIGSGGELSCLVYPEGIPAGGTISKILSEVAKEVHFERVRLVDVTVVEANPTAYIEAEYSAPDGAGNKVFGQFKMLLYASADNPVLCLHDEVGFRASFRRISEGLFRSLRLANADPAPRYTQIHVARLGQVPIGYEQTSMVDGKEDKQIISTDGATFLPRSPGALSYGDDSTTEVVDRQGGVLVGAYSSVKDGQVQYSVRVDRTGEGQYGFKGERKGKPVEGSFRSRGKRGLISSLAATDEVRKTLLSGKAADLTIEEYHPGSDPSRTVDVIYRRKEGRTVTFQFDGVEMSTVRDDRGQIEKAAITAGTQQVSVDRVFVRGSP
jgi:hypothetical protein